MNKILLSLFLILLLSLLSWAYSKNDQDNRTSGRSTNLWDTLGDTMGITPAEPSLPTDVYESRLCSIKDIQCYDDYCRQYDGQVSKCRDKSDWCQYDCSKGLCHALPVPEKTESEELQSRSETENVETCADSCNDRCECLANSICNVNPENNECGDDTLYFLSDEDCTYCRREYYYQFDILVEGKNPGVKSNPFYDIVEGNYTAFKVNKSCIINGWRNRDLGVCDVEKFILGVNFNGDSGKDTRGFEYKSDTHPDMLNILSYTDDTAWAKQEFSGKKLDRRLGEAPRSIYEGSYTANEDLAIHGRWITSKDKRTNGQILDAVDKINCLTLNLDSLTDGRYEVVLVVVRNHKFALSVFTVRLNSKSVRVKINYNGKDRYYVYELVTYFDVKSGWIVNTAGKQMMELLEGNSVQFSVCAGECSISLKEHETNLNLAAIRFSKIKTKK